MIDKPYDWDHYEDEWYNSPTYATQERELQGHFEGLKPKTVLEVGPGLGRVTKILVDMYPRARFALADLSTVAIEKTSRALPDVDFSMSVGPLQAVGQLNPLSLGHFPSLLDGAPGFDLVVAVEVLMHIHPDLVPRAIANLLGALSTAQSAHGILITCDWTESLPTSGGIPTPVRNSNYRHDYLDLFRLAGAKFGSRKVVGLQSIFVVQC